MYHIRTLLYTEVGFLFVPFRL